MDYRSTLTIALFILTFSLTIAQDDCISKPEFVKTDTCRYVRMSVPTFTSYYIAKKNLKTISKEVNPALKAKFDSLLLVHSLVVEAHGVEKSILEAKQDETKASYDEVMNLAIEVDEENGNLWQENDWLKKYGLGGAGVIGMILGILIAK